MPIYEYRCNRCARTDEKLMKSYEDSNVKIPCPEHFCGGVQHKILSKGSFVMLDAFGDSVKAGAE